PALTNAFVAEFARRLQGRGAALALPLTWMEQRLAESGQTIEQLVHLEAQQQASNQVTVSNSIGSLRLLGAMDWREFVEALSSVEQALRDDPSGVYPHMDFGTRDRYRHAVESIARVAGRAEADVARAAVALAVVSVAKDTTDAQRDGRTHHVGHYLIGSGRAALESAIGFRLPAAMAFGRALRARSLPLYAGAIIFGTLALCTGPLLEVHYALAWPWFAEFAFALCVLLAVSQLAVSLVNWMVTLLVAPQPLPRMDYSGGIASESRTLVVVPTMLGSAAGVDAQVDALEMRFLANRDPHLHFGLLTDFHDAATEHMPSDAAVVNLAAAKIAALNAKYSGARETDAFFLLHRPRQWNAREHTWMGRERKRGKLSDLNALLRGNGIAGEHPLFSRIVGDTRALLAVRYVITLDADTQLPRDAAALIVATMAHALNRPCFGTGVQRDIVVDGYGILQPRVGLSLPSTNRSGYARLYGGEPGIDPYTRAVSDVYQDLFGEGSFVGKGIYDVDAFERALAGRLPENRVLSHDLLEGCFARAGLLSDVQLLEESPTRYRADAARRYRWIRGDWQLLGWLGRRLPGLAGARNPLSALSRAKIVDNLRRSLAAPALLAMLLIGWWLLPRADVWTLRALAVITLVPLAAQLADWMRRPLKRLRATESASVARPALHQALRLLLQMGQTIACLPHEAMYSVGAIAITLWRMTISRRRLLEWRPSADVAVETPAGTVGDLVNNLRTLAVGPLLAIACALGLSWWRPFALAAATPVLLLWLASPALVWWIDRPLTRRRLALTTAQMVFLRRLARRTWAFFEVHVGADDHHLPPDNVQEQPVARAAHRTSPTNMGFALLASLAARDFGYQTTGQLLSRVEAALATMQGLERYRGHFYNWYDTQTLQPLRPHYISTVDSGNLAGQLLVLRAGLLALADEPLMPPGWWEGVHDTFGLLKESLAAASIRRGGALSAALAEFDQHLRKDLRAEPLTLVQWRDALDALEHLSTRIVSAVVDDAARDTAVAASEDTADDECMLWALKLAEHCRAGIDEMQVFAMIEGGAHADMPSLRALATRDAGRDAGARDAARLRLQLIDDLAARTGALADMEQDFLYDDSRHLMSIGYNVDERRTDAGYYDLLASEA
ncbi:MAG: cyclic beta 1-2 glucan synthetase, partial [Casimicrobiaceae bacterium]